MKGASSPVDPLKLNTGCTGWKIRRDSGSQRPGAADEGGVDSMETQGSGPVWKLGSPRASSLWGRRVVRVTAAAIATFLAQVC